MPSRKRSRKSHKKSRKSRRCKKGSVHGRNSGKCFRKSSLIGKSLMKHKCYKKVVKSFLKAKKRLEKCSRKYGKRVINYGML